MIPEKRSNNDILETQIIVIGGGGAGMAAAVSAAENGANVVLLEKSHKPLGSSGMAHGIFAADSPTQKRMNIEPSRDILFKIMMDFSHWSIDPNLIRTFLDKTPDTIKWLEDKGLVFDIPLVNRKHFGQPVPRVWHCPKGYGAEIIDVLKKEFETLGGHILCDTRAPRILIDDNNCITGILAEQKGNEIRILGNQVIIATGGYGSNKEMMKKYCPYYRENQYYEGYPAHGDGISMAMEIGAATEGMGTLYLFINGIVGLPREMNYIAGLADSLWLNIRGERFVDESAWSHKSPGGFNPLIKQPETRSYTFFDQGILDLVIGDQGENVDHYRDLKNHSTGDNGSLSDIFALAIKKGILKISDSLDDMARWMGCKTQTLESTVDKYNTFCDKKHDDDFLKLPEFLTPLRKPPFYSISCFPRMVATIGGVKITPEMEALDNDGNIIPGLYVTGTDAAGYESDTYNHNLQATFFGFAVNSGRIAGENAAIRVLSS